MLRVLVCSVALLVASSASTLAKKEKVTPKDPKELGRVAVVPYRERGGGNEYRQVILDEVEESLTKHKIETVPRQEVSAAMQKLRLSVDNEEVLSPEQLVSIGKAVNARYLLTGVVHQVDFQDVAERGVVVKLPSARVQFQVFDVSAGLFQDDLGRTVTAQPQGLGLRKSESQRTKAVQQAAKNSMRDFLAPYAKRR